MPEVPVSPTSPSSLCRQCSSRAIEGRKYCAVHATTSNDLTTARRHWAANSADDPVRPLYNCKRWSGTRRQVLLRDPLCCLCEHRASTVADHYPLSAREIVRQLSEREFYNAD